MRLPIACVAANPALVFAVFFLQFASFPAVDVTVVVIAASGAVKLRALALELTIFLRSDAPAAPIAVLLNINIPAISGLPAAVLPAAV